MSEATLHAFRLHENLYFIGTEAVSVHLLDTEAGLVLIDTGYPNMREVILENIRTLGYSPEKIVAIFHTHAHIDHFGCTRELVALSGATTYMSRVDDDIFNGPCDLTWAKELRLTPIPPFRADVRIEDGDEFTFGSTRVRCLLTPGHTAGTISLFLTLPDGTVAAMHGGIGTNTLRSAFLLEYGLPFTSRDDLIASCEKLKGERVDLVIGNHPEQADTVEKMQKKENGEEILDKEEWGRLLSFVISWVGDLEKTDPRK